MPELELGGVRKWSTEERGRRDKGMQKWSRFSVQVRTRLVWDGLDAVSRGLCHVLALASEKYTRIVCVQVRTRPVRDGLDAVL